MADGGGWTSGYGARPAASSKATRRNLSAKAGENRIVGEPARAWSLAASLIDKQGMVDVGRVADTFRMSKGQLAETVGLATATLAKSNRRSGAKAQNRMIEMLEIIGRIREWAGGEAQAMAWYRSQPIPALDGRTPEALVKSGRAGAVRDYLDHLALGGFA